MTVNQVECLIEFRRVGLVLGRRYSIVKEHKIFYEVVCDNGVETWGYKSWFKVVRPKHRKKRKKRKR